MREEEKLQNSLIYNISLEIRARANVKIENNVAVCIVKGLF